MRLKMPTGALDSSRVLGFYRSRLLQVWIASRQAFRYAPGASSSGLLIALYEAKEMRNAENYLGQA
jgi:hypothetical protein